MTTIIALGDLHGQVGSLARLKMVQKRYANAITVFIGDYIDSFSTNHGFELLEQIWALQRADPAHTVVLRGNHEQGMLEYMADETHHAWLIYGGQATLRTVANTLTEDQGNSYDRRLILDRKRALLAWSAALPFIYVHGKLAFVHAGLDMTAPDPIAMTSQYDRLWMRATYWYAPERWGVFGDNQLSLSLITGHTPTGQIQGQYRNEIHRGKLESEHNPIYAVSYPGEMPRYFIDGGVGGGNEHLLGNIAVFDDETGLLIDAYED